MDFRSDDFFLEHTEDPKFPTNLKRVFPRVISVSRATDIPAWHTGWLMKCLRSGYCEWQNPFNLNQKQIVVFKKTQAIVFWSKYPAPLLPFLPEISEMGMKFYFQFTLNNYPCLEAGVPAINERIKIFRKLARNYPVIWRYDPVILGDDLTIDWHLQTLKFLLNEIGDVIVKLVFSFVDVYPRVSKNLRHFNPELRAPIIAEMEHFSTELAELRDNLAPSLTIATCAETGIDFKKLGIEKNSCIDAGLINRICGQEIYKELSGKRFACQGDLLPHTSAMVSPTPRFERDKNQRKECQCAPAKDIGSYARHYCKHRCIYCYAGHMSD